MRIDNSRASRLSVKGHIVKIFDFIDQIISITTIQFYCCEKSTVSIHKREMTGCDAHTSSNEAFASQPDSFSEQEVISS